MEQTNKRDLLQKRIYNLQTRIDYLSQIKLSEKHTVTLTIFLPDYPQSNEINFDTDQPEVENLLNLTSCFLFLHLTNLNAILDELKNQLNNGSY